MIKTIAKLEHKIGSREYQFLCDNDSPVAEIKESLCQFLKCIGQIEDQIKVQEDLKKKENIEDIKENKIEEIG